MKVVLGLALILAVLLPTTADAAAGPGCNFVLGFKTLHDQLPAQVGACMEDQAFAANGNAEQHTSGGLLVWRKADNWTAFTDGFRTWINGPDGLQQRLNSARFPWEADAGIAGWTGAGVAFDGALTLRPAPNSFDCTDVASGHYDSSTGLCTATDGQHGYNGGSFVYASAISPVNPAAPFTRLVASWNATTPAGTWIEVHARAQVGQAWTRWYSLGVWASDTASVQRHSLDNQADQNGDVATDTLELKRAASAYQLQVTLFAATAGATPAVQSVSAVAFNPHPNPLSEGDGTAVELAVPARSQMLGAYRGLGLGGGGEAWCSPTSTSMIMAYWADVLGRPELRQAVPTVAAGTYDYAYQGAGNWPFNVAYAASFGLAGRVGQFDSFSALQPWLAARVPVAISISFQAGQLSGAPIASTPGHLIVVRGFNAAGAVLVDDPAEPSDGMATTYNRAELERAWQSGSGGIAYLLYPPDWPIPS